MTVHTVKRGENLSLIARKYGIRSWQEIYNHPSNATFRHQRPNPNLIHPGDQINIPEKGGRQFTHRVTLHFRSLSLTNASFQSHLTSAEQVYAQYGIKIVFGSGMSLHLTDEQLKKYTQVDGTCNWKITTGEIAEIQKLGGSTSSGVTVFYVDRFKSGILGCGGHAPNKPACLVARSGSKWDTAHELGHVLLTSSFTPVHSTDINNLMHATASSYAKTPILTPKQVEQIKKSPFCVKTG